MHFIQKGRNIDIHVCRELGRYIELSQEEVVERSLESWLRRSDHSYRKGKGGFDGRKWDYLCVEKEERREGETFPKSFRRSRAKASRAVWIPKRVVSKDSTVAKVGSETGNTWSDVQNVRRTIRCI